MIYFATSILSWNTVSYFGGTQLKAKRISNNIKNDYNNKSLHHTNFMWGSLLTAGDIELDLPVCIFLDEISVVELRKLLL